MSMHLEFGLTYFQFILGRGPYHFEVDLQFNSVFLRAPLVGQLFWSTSTGLDVDGWGTLKATGEA